VGGTTYKSADPKVKSIQMDLRIREDTAKYLLNLDPNSAPYDPKSRTLKENPNPGSKGGFKGDNFVKISGDYLNLIKDEALAIELSKHNENMQVNTVANPSAFALYKKEHERKKAELASMQEK
jgi:pre-mRNA-processing factor SLU7